MHLEGDLNLSHVSFLSFHDVVEWFILQPRVSGTSFLLVSGNLDLGTHIKSFPSLLHYGTPHSFTYLTPTHLFPSQTPTYSYYHLCMQFSLSSSLSHAHFSPSPHASFPS